MIKLTQLSFYKLNFLIQLLIQNSQSVTNIFVLLVV